MQFPTNSLVSQLSFDRDIGAQLRTDFPIGPVWFHLAAMLANGDGGFRQRRNIDDEFLYVGRLEIAPFGRMERTEPDLAHSDFQLTAGFSAGRNGALGNDLGLQDAGATETKVEGDLRAWFKGASLRGEYLRGCAGVESRNELVTAWREANLGPEVDLLLQPRELGADFTAGDVPHADGAFKDTAGRDPLPVLADVDAVHDRTPAP